MVLTIDIGNSRIKWALWLNNKIIYRAAVSYESGSCSDAFEQLYLDSEQHLRKSDGAVQIAKQNAIKDLADVEPVRVFAICVAGDLVKKALESWVMQRWGLAVNFLKTQKRHEKIINAYDDPDQHGVDRWLGLIAACQRYPDNAVCVIGAGTAITFDFVRQNGEHLGGYILPSIKSMHAALSMDTAKVASMFEMEYRQQRVPDNTKDAVNQGLHKLLQAGLRDLCRHAKQELGESMQIIITGGFAPVILSYPDMPEMKHEPDLIMHGIYNIINSQKS